MNKKGSFADVFVFMIVSLIMIIVFAVFIYAGATTYNMVRTQLQNDTTIAGTNMTLVVDQTLGKVNEAYQSLYWISVAIMVFMIIGIFISSYIVATKPIWLIPYFILTIVAIFVAVGIELAYEGLMNNPQSAVLLEGFVGANFLMSKLPIIVAITGVFGAFILFWRAGSRQSPYGVYQ